MGIRCRERNFKTLHRVPSRKQKMETHYGLYGSKEYAKQYRLENYKRVRENEKRYQVRRQNELKKNPELLEKEKTRRRKYIREWKRQYRRRLGIPARVFNRNGKGRQKLNIWLEKLAKEYGKFCVECGNDKRLTVNHKMPRCVGGKTEKSNLEIMCLSCNVKTFHELTKKALKFYFANKQP